MKLLFVVFAVFSYAVLAQNQSGTSVEQQIRELINIYTENIKKDFIEVYYNVENAINETVKKIEYINTTYLKSLEYEIVSVQSQINSYVNKGSHYRICALQQLSYFQNISNIMRNNSKLCGSGYSQSFQNYEEQITKDISEVENHLIDNRLGVIGCIHLSPIETTNCVFEKIGNYSIVIQDISKAQEYTIKDHATRTIALATSCYKDVLDSSKAENRNILKNINTCISTSSA